jgi:hypothetical protein
VSRKSKISDDAALMVGYASGSRDGGESDRSSNLLRKGRHSFQNVDLRTSWCRASSNAKGAKETPRLWTTGQTLTM